MSQQPPDPAYPAGTGDGTPGEGTPPQSAPPPSDPYQSPYQYPAATAPVVRRPPLITRADVADAARDALVPLAAALVLVFGIIAGLANLLSSTAHGGFHDWFTSTVIVTAGALGASTSLSLGSALDSDSSDLGGLSFNLSFELDLAVWIVTFALLAAWAWRARRREAAAPSASPGQLAARSALSALGVSLVLLILALASSTADLYGLGNAMLGSSLGSDDSSGSGFSGDSGSSGTDPFGSGTDSGGFGSGSLATASTGGSAHASIGVQPGWVFVGPLLLALLACAVGRLAAVSRRPAGDPGGEWIRNLTGPWRGVGAVLWTQLRAVALLAGLTVAIYAEYELLHSDGPGRVKTALTLLIVLMLPNLALGGLLTGFGVTLFAGVGLIGIAGLGGTGLGLFGDSRPWLIWVLIAEALVGTALPWILVRTRRRAVHPAAFAPGQVWRAALIGALGGFAVALLGQISVSGSVGLAVLGGSNATAGLVYSTFGAIAAGALWCAAAYLAVSLQVTPRLAPAPTALTPDSPPPPTPPHGWPTVEGSSDDPTP
jgi:hypothetical protein